MRDINRTGGDLRKVSPLCLCIVLSAATATLGLVYTATEDFKEVAGLVGIL